MTVDIPSLTLCDVVYRDVRATSLTYDDGALALRLDVLDADYGTREPLLTASANLRAYGLHPAAGCAFLRDYSEAEGVAKALTDIGVVSPTGRVEYAGFGRFVEVSLHGDLAEDRLPRS